MSEDLDKAILEVLNQLKELNKQRNDLLEKMTVNDRLNPWEPPPSNLPDRIERYNKFHYITNEISLLQDKFTGMAIASVNKSVEKVADSSKKLETSTRVLMALTAFLAWAAVTSFFAQVPGFGFTYAPHVGLILMLLVYLFIRSEVHPKRSGTT